MKHEEFQENLHKMTDRKLIEEATLVVDNLCKTGAKSFTMNVPPKLTDCDIILNELIRRFEERIIL